MKRKMIGVFFPNYYEKTLAAFSRAKRSGKKTPGFTKVIKRLSGEFSRVTATFSEKAGCCCGCSPGFRIYADVVEGQKAGMRHFWEEGDVVKCRYPHKKDFYI